MRLWTVHPKYLDAQGLVALWREALLAREVLRGRTVGYRRHPQLERFRRCGAPCGALNAFLEEVYREARARGYAFDAGKLGRCARLKVSATRGQLLHEWSWLLAKLKARSPERYRQHGAVLCPDPHPLFTLREGPVAAWERNIAAHHQR